MTTEIGEGPTKANMVGSQLQGEGFNVTNKMGFTGSVEVQIAILTAEINAITAHVSTNKKDFSTKRGLFKKVSQRRSLLNYLERTDIEKYRALVKKLEIRK